MNKTLYIQCNMGAAGDMLNAALYELLDDEKKTEYLKVMNSLIPGVKVIPETVSKCGISGTHMMVLIEGEEEGHDHHHTHDHHEHHHHFALSDIENLINEAPVSDFVRAKAIAVYKLIAEAEGHAHNTSVAQIHFHEVGTKDAVADVLGACYLMELLGNPKVIVSDINTGYGSVKCAHGILPVPAPATAYILKNAPIYQGCFEGEMCTPTGAALLMTLKCDFGRMPVMKTEGCGYGMGCKDFPEANCVRAFVGIETEGRNLQTITGLSCNVDDMTGEQIAFVKEMLLSAGALDVYSFATDMKKGRPGIEIVCLVKPEDEDRMVGIILANTTSWGVRRQSYERFYMDRHIETLETEYGPVRIKTGEGFGIRKWKPEYEDLAEISRKYGIPIDRVKDAVSKLVSL